MPHVFENECQLHMTLALLPLQQEAIVESVGLPEAEVEWLRAVGLAEGERLWVVRKAPLRGPLHIRTSLGGEFAVDRTLAAAVRVKVTK
jgi:Fe2+ transport system protein FeoA